SAYLTNVTRVLSPSINVTASYTYSFTAGMTLTVKDPMGNVSSFTYDPIQRLNMTKFAPVSGRASNMTFLFQDSQDSFGLENQKGNYTDFMYDGQNRVTQVSLYKGGLDASPILAQANYTYAMNGNIKSAQDPSGNVTTYSYDYLNRLVKVVNPDGTTRIISYNDTSLVESSFDENGHQTDNLYDNNHRLIGVRQFYSTSGYFLTTYSYNGVGALAKMTDAKGQATTYSYDDLNRPTLTVFPDGFNETRTYDSIGNLVARKDPNGKTTTYSYDALNRL